MRGVGISQRLEKNNSSSTKVMVVLQSPKGRLAQIELLVCSAGFLLIFLEVFGACRRRCNNGKFRLLLWAAYTMPPYLITYAFGLMHAAPFKNELFVIWAVFLMIALGSADSFSAYKLEDNEQWKTYNWQLIMKATALLLLLNLYADSSDVMYMNVFLYIGFLVKLSERAQSLMLASRDILRKKNKLIADYMSKEHLKSNQDEVDLISMKGYAYIVRGEEEKFENLCQVIRRCIKRPFEKKKPAEAPDYHVPFEAEPEAITTEKVWQCQGRLLQARDSDHRIKDICLSFAFFKILSLRFSGYSLPLEAHEKSWKLFQKIIACKEDGFERVFRIIEVELSFVFDQLYTKYPVIFLPGRWVMKLTEIFIAIFGSWNVATTIMDYKKSEGSMQLAMSNGLSIDVIVTAAVVVVVLILEILQLCFLNFSEWGKVVWICNYVKKEAWQKNKYMEKLIEFICHTQLLKPWERKLHQYDLLRSYAYTPSALLYNNLTVTYIDQARDGQNQSTPTELSIEVKSAVISSLVANSTKLENGKVSLSQNDMPMLLWACNLKTQAQVIMVWHIATSMCEYEVPAKSNTNFSKNFRIATNLSKYLAYLVAFAPRLLPDHPYVTEYVFDQVIIEARDALRKCNSLGKRIRALKDISSREGSETVIDRGAQLGKQLLIEVKDPEIIWRVLAEFWAELMVYVAPSNDMAAHAEHLTMGGEFVTHIWALLSHSGIEREPKETPKLERSQC